MDLRQAIASFDLEAYVRETFDPVVPSGAEELRINCFAPNGCNGDTKQHLYVNVQKRAWICYKCGYGDHKVQPGTGRLIQFMSDAEGLSVGQVIRRLASAVQPTPADELSHLLELQFAEVEEAPATKGEVIELPQVFVPCPPMRYLRERGLDCAMLPRFDARWCGSRRLTLWHQRVIFPIPNLAGEYVSAVGRVIVKRKPRWQNWPGSDIQSLLWPLGTWEPEWVPFEVQGGHVVLVEGAFDVLGVRSTGAGYQALATLGKKLSLQQIQILQQLGVSEVTLAWDYDARDKMLIAVDKLLGRIPKINIFPLRDPRWQDCDFGDMLRPERREMVSVFKAEMDHRIPVESHEYLAWETAVRMEV